MILLGLDPGKKTGYYFVNLEEDTPMEVLDHGVIEGGVEGFHEWWLDGSDVYWQTDLIISEIFEIDGTITGTWSPQIEGALKVLWDGEIVWQKRDDKAALLPGEPARKKWLKEHGFQFDATHDMDALTHLIVYIKRHKTEHMASIREWWPET